MTDVHGIYIAIGSLGAFISIFFWFIFSSFRKEIREDMNQMEERWEKNHKQMEERWLKLDERWADLLGKLHMIDKDVDRLKERA